MLFFSLKIEISGRTFPRNSELGGHVPAIPPPPGGDAHAPYLPAASPGVFVGEDNRASGGRGHDLERNLPTAKLLFFICFRALEFAKTWTTHF